MVYLGVIAKGQNVFCDLKYLDICMGVGPERLLLVTAVGRWR